MRLCNALVYSIDTFVQGTIPRLVLLTYMEPYYFDKKAIAIVDKWIKESEEPYQDAYISLNWYEPIRIRTWIA